jgi:hypothetical protein
MVVVLDRDEEVLFATAVAIAASICGTSSSLLSCPLLVPRSRAYAYDQPE